MKPYQRILILLFALLLAVSVFGCAKPQENDPDATAAPGETDATSVPADVGSYDPEAIAVELGDITIKASEIEDAYYYYMSMLESYYSSTPTDDASIKEYRDLAVDDVIRYYVPQWKAAALGVTLSEADEATINVITAQEIEELRNDLICNYAYYYANTDVETYEELTEEEIDIALNQIASELEEYFGAGYTLDQYLSDQYDVSLANRRMEKLKDVLRQANSDAAEVTEEQITAWYEETLKKQQETFDADPLAYREHLTDYQNGDTKVPALYLPNGLIKVQVIEVLPEAERDIKIDTNRAEMATLEAEYGALVLNNEDAERQAEIVARYAELKAENEQLEEQFLGEARRTINAAYEALEEEAAFETVMESVNTSGAIEMVLLADGEDSDYPELAEAAQALLVDTYSEPLLINDGYYIVKRLESEKPGVLDRAENEEAIRAAALDELTGEAWDALYEEWETEALTTAIRHEETYAAVGYMSMD